MSEVDDDYTEIVDVEMNEIDFELEHWNGFVEEGDALNVVEEGKVVEELKDVEKIDLNQLDVEEFEDLEKVRDIEKIDLNQLEVEGKAVEGFEDVENVRDIEKIDLNHQVVHYK